MGCKLVITLLRCCRDCRGIRRSAKDELARAEAGLVLYRQVEAKNKRPSLYPVQFSHIGWWISFCDPTVSRYAGMMFFFPQLGDLHNHKDYHKTLKKKAKKPRPISACPGGKLMKLCPQRSPLSPLRMEEMMQVSLVCHIHPRTYIIHHFS